MHHISIEEDECVDLLTKNNHKIIQKKKGFRFSVDPVLLANFCKLKEYDKVIDLGTGNAIIPLILANTIPNLHIVGLEILKSNSDMAIRSIKLNNLESQVSIVNNDLKNIKEIYPGNSFDAVICNPPYYAKTTGNINPDHTQAIARHEIACTLEDVVFSAKYLLKEQGRFFIIIKPQRISELFILLNNNKLNISKIRFVHPNLKEKANFVLIESCKKNKKVIEVINPLIIYNSNGNYCDEINKMYFP